MHLEGGTEENSGWLLKDLLHTIQNNTTNNKPSISMPVVESGSKFSML